MFNGPVLVWPKTHTPQALMSMKGQVYHFISFAFPKNRTVLLKIEY